MSLRLVVFVGAVFLLACSGPSSGNYDFVVVDEQSDCPESFESLDSPEGEQTLTVSGDEVVVEGNPSSTCSLDGNVFHCPFTEIDQEQDYGDQGLDAVYLVDAEMDGEWITSSAIEGTMSITTSCEGEDCESLADMGAPSCTITWDFTAEK